MSDAQGKFLHCAGVQNLSYGDAGCPIAGGESTAALSREMQASKRRHDAAGLCSIQIKSDEEMCATSLRTRCSVQCCL